MKTRVTLLLVLAIVLTIAPTAMANHCLGCRPLRETCVYMTNYGFLYCDWDDFSSRCITSDPCGSHTAAAQLEPLASEFLVASVERLDEPQTNTNETRVASLATAPAANH